MITRHPLGVAYHPEWRAVRDRWNDRYCAQVMERAATERRAQTERPGISTRTLLAAAVVSAFLAVAWAAGMAVMS